MKRVNKRKNEGLIYDYIKIGEVFCCRFLLLFFFIAYIVYFKTKYQSCDHETCLIFFFFFPKSLIINVSLLFSASTRLISRLRRLNVVFTSSRPKWLKRTRLLRKSRRSTRRLRRNTTNSQSRWRMRKSAVYDGFDRSFVPFFFFSCVMTNSRAVMIWIMMGGGESLMCLYCN